jgi:CBS-domain-containing membrane protein
MNLPRYLQKLRGRNQGCPPRVSPAEILWSWLGAFLGIGLAGWLEEQWFAPADLPLLIGSLGASAVLLYGAPRSPLAQPRNLLGGHIVSALVGVACFQAFGGVPWLAAGSAVAGAIALMHVTRTLHPPGGATALIAVVGSAQIHALGWWYVLVPATVGPLVLLLVALPVNNLAAGRHYPECWW